MKTSTFNQVTATASAIHRAVRDGGDRFKVVLNAIRGLGKDAQRKNRQDIAVALFTASTHRDPDALMNRAMDAAIKAADEVFHASLLLATMSALPELRVEPVSPLVLPVGEAKTFTPIHNAQELLHVLSSDPELQESLMRQGASRLKAKGLTSKVKMASIDGGCQGVNDVKAGTYLATVMQFPKKMAEDGVKAVVKFAADGTKYTYGGLVMLPMFSWTIWVR